MSAEGEVSDQWLRSALVTYCQVLVELVEDETHAVHEAVHVGWLAFVVGGSLVSSERSLEGLEVLHPLDREVVRSYICLVEDEDEGKFCFVEDTIAEALSVRDAEHNDRR